MFNLVKYEWFKRWRFFLAGLVVFLLMDIDIVYRVMHKASPNLLFVVLGAILTVMGFILFFSQILRMYSTIFSEEGQLFLTMPLNGYRFLGGKLLAVVIECFVVLVSVGVVGYIDYLIVAPVLGHIELPRQITITGSSLLLEGTKAIFIGFLGYVSLLLMVYLSMVLAKSIFASVKHGKALSFVIFILILGVVGKIGDLAFAQGQHCDFMGSSALLIPLVIILFGITGYLLDRKMNI